MRIAGQHARIVHDVPHQRFAERVAERHVVVLVKIALHCVHENIRRAAGRLVGGQSHRQLRVHYGELCAGKVGVIGALERAFFVCDDAAVAHFAACDGDGQHDAERQTGGRFPLFFEKVPHVALVCSAVGDGLRGVDHAAAADGQNEIDALTAAKLDALINQRKVRIGHHAAQRHERNVFRFERPFDAAARKPARFFRRNESAPCARPARGAAFRSILPRLCRTQRGSARKTQNLHTWSFAAFLLAE